jgi:hypothetical protein
MLPAGAAAAGHAGPQQPLVPVESFGLAVRMAERRGGCRALVQVSCQPVLAAAGRRWARMRVPVASRDGTSQACSMGVALSE